MEANLTRSGRFDTVGKLAITQSDRKELLSRWLINNVFKPLVKRAA